MRQLGAPLADASRWHGFAGLSSDVKCTKAAVQILCRASGLALQCHFRGPRWTPLRVQVTIPRGNRIDDDEQMIRLEDE